MFLDQVREGLFVKTNEKLRLPKGCPTAAYHLKVRKPNQLGMVARSVSGEESEYWYVQHLNSDQIGVYGFDEFEPDPGEILDENGLDLTPELEDRKWS